ncbi:SusC/RagA family TonB-linked outer membrane protein [Bacteroides stercoris]|uniref:Putative outer membrane receptor protein, mostly for Fe transport n=1 Tax=Bacteroides stercoris TaxID=46506 RepID=A0A108TA18_BACSE|nr:TonB-dependent receptor [Bacteroides stercoris]KWR56123.1 putative outer membrane receptor protein, mostly for Fe transport [Bacteroides stercoris]
MKFNLFSSKSRVRQFCLTMLCLFLFQGVIAQNKMLVGTVVDELGETLIGVSVLNKTTGEGTITAIDGSFSLSGKQNDLIQFSYIGYASVDYVVKQEENIRVVLKEDTQNLEEVVVVGYSAQKKSSLTGAIAPVNMDDMEKRRVATVSQALQGQVAGVQITQSTGAPGDDISMLIRGEGTIGNNSPLYIIDGVPSRTMTFLNPSDISSITVLKDASAAAVYGSRASGGVVVITTKEGEVGKGHLELNYYYGIQKVANLPRMLNTQQYMDVQEIAWNNASYEGSNPYTIDKKRTDLADTDWLDELFTLGQTHNIQATMSGGSKGVNYLLSAGYISQDGIVVYDNDRYRRFSLRSNINAKYYDRLNIGANVQLTYSIQDKLNSKGDAPGIIRHAMLRPSVLSVYKDVNDPTYKANDPFTDLPFYKNNDRNGGWESSKYEWTSNPIALAYYTDDKRSQYTTFGNVFAEYEFLQDHSLKFKTNLGIDLNLYHNKAFNQNFGDDDGSGSDVDKGLGRQNRPSNLDESRGESFTLTWNNTLSYAKQFERHNINAVAGTEFISNYESSIGASRQRYDYTNDTFRYLDFGGTESDIWNSGSGSEWALMSVFASATYVYDNRYMITGNFRADASSRFASNHAWGFFPSVSAGWKMSEEKFLKNISWLSDLKLRGSWGQLGNQEIDNYTFMTLLKKDGDKYVISRYGNPDLKWETSEQWNVGVDLGILRNKLYLSADYFMKTTSDILLPISLPSYVGSVSPTIVNAGTVRNKGFELSLTYRDKVGDFNYSINGNIATLDNKVLKLHPNLPNIDGKVTRTTVGQPLNAYYGFVMEGIYQNEAEINEQLYATDNPTVQPGDIRFKDLDNNGKIDDNDRDFLGSPIPRFTYGFTLNGEYKGFNFSMLFHGVQDVQHFNDLKKILNYDTRPFNHTTEMLGYWHGEGTSNSIPRPSFTDNGGSRISSIFVEDASFFRLKNVELGYSFAKLLKKINSPISDLKIYVSAENLFTVTSYSGLDPESTDLIDYGTYPQARSFLFGVNVKF